MTRINVEIKLVWQFKVKLQGMSGAEEYSQEPSICIQIRINVQISKRFHQSRSNFLCQHFFFQMTAHYLLQGSVIASPSSRCYAPVCKRKFLILDQKFFFLIVIQNILQRLPLLWYDK